MSVRLFALRYSHSLLYISSSRSTSLKRRLSSNALLVKLSCRAASSEGTSRPFRYMAGMNDLSFRLCRTASLIR
ncbi:hypothetical protein AGDE_13085 [Angomonas deanei]|uniref:Uncharacterized protein n=1 Tax=Angomonas deanei TaxID=59799 RepID=A0A7G2CFH2_9TRYP|nr:hypothetical protein AGDE_13085 [Angomonas deanei]CAD2218580.1 hypothetical protein, conserved [Angomonas deanei]|eukprot:EPY22759.1 hypothetical protein AGDE_13085 [Angomonas deanei]